MSWEQFNNLVKSSNYETIGNRFEKIKKGSNVATFNENEGKVLDNIKSQMEKFVPGFKKEFIQFKNYTINIDKEFCYAENEIIYFSNKILNEPNWKNFVLAKCLEIKRVSYKKIVELLKLID